MKKKLRNRCVLEPNEEARSRLATNVMKRVIDLSKKKNVYNVSLCLLKIFFLLSFLCFSSESGAVEIPLKICSNLSSDIFSGSNRSPPFRPIFVPFPSISEEVLHL